MHFDMLISVEDDNLDSWNFSLQSNLDSLFPHGNFCCCSFVCNPWKNNQDFYVSWKHDDCSSINNSDEFCFHMAFFYVSHCLQAVKDESLRISMYHGHLSSRKHGNCIHMTDTSANCWQKHCGNFYFAYAMFLTQSMHIIANRPW